MTRLEFLYKELGSLVDDISELAGTEFEEVEEALDWLKEDGTDDSLDFLDKLESVIDEIDEIESESDVDEFFDDEDY